MNRGLWTIVATAVCVGTGIVIGEQLRGSASADRVRLGQAQQFQLAQGPLGVPAPQRASPTRIVTSVSGTIQSIDVRAGRMVLSSGMGAAESQTVIISGETQITRQTRSSVAEIRVGESISIHGVPLRVEAASMYVHPRAAGASGTPSPGSQPGGTGPVPGQPGRDRPGSTVMLSGRVTSTSPLKITIGENAECGIEARPGAEVTRATTVTLRDLKLGERVIGSGFATDDGSVEARNLTVITVASSAAGATSPRPGIGAVPP